MKNDDTIEDVPSSGDKVKDLNPKPYLRMASNFVARVAGAALGEVIVEAIFASGDVEEVQEVEIPSLFALGA